MPGIVANVLDIPNKMLAYCGAMSNGLMLWNIKNKNRFKFNFSPLIIIYLNPDQANAPRPTANVKQVIDPIADEEFAAKYIKMVWLMKAPQLKIFLTYEIL